MPVFKRFEPVYFLANVALQVKKLPIDLELAALDVIEQVCIQIWVFHVESIKVTFTLLASQLRNDRLGVDAAKFI